MIQLMKGDSFLVAELQQTAMRAFIGFPCRISASTKLRSVRDELVRRARGQSDAPLRVRLLQINPEIAKQTTVLAT
jgi:hypothetical protein